MFKAENYSEDDKKAVWNKAKIIPNADSNKWRKDFADAWISWDKYGDASSELGYGWEIDHRHPQSKGGKDTLDNLQALQWSNNRTKGDDYPSFKTSVSSSANQNIKKIQSWTYNK
jgi:hypothetical protein